MALSEWLELENLSTEIADTQGRLDAAKSVESLDLADLLEREIVDMEERRSKLLANIATSVVADKNSAQSEQRDPEDSDTAGPRSVAALDDSENSTKQGPVKGDDFVWEQLTPADVDRARQELGRQRIEMLARHAEELNLLEGDCAQVDQLEQAINAFIRKYSPPAGAEVVQLGSGRQARA